MKKFRLFALVIIGTFFIASATIGIYTENQARKFGEETAKYLWSRYSGEPQYVQLGDLLYSNVHTQIKTGEKAGAQTPQSYKLGWRNVLAKNPTLGHVAVKEYSDEFIEAFNKRLLEGYNDMTSPNARWRQRKAVSVGDEAWSSLEGGFVIVNENNIQTFPDQNSVRKDSLELAEELENFSIEDYWQKEFILLQRYKILTQKLLTLPDATLNKYIKDVGMEQENYGGNENFIATEAHLWLFKNDLIGAIPESEYDSGKSADEGGWYLGHYPCDLLFLTYRVNRDLPEWTPRKFLTETNTLIAEIEKIISQQ